MKKTLLLLLATVMLVGCATGHWTKPNFTNEEWRKDYYECDYNANTYCYRCSGLLACSLCRSNNLSFCLQSRGYEYVKGEKSTPSADEKNQILVNSVLDQNGRKIKEELKYSEPPKSKEEPKSLESPEKGYQREITFADGSKYIGNIVNGRMHGQGTYIWSSGDKYIGEFADNRATGGWFYRVNGTKLWVSQDSEGKWIISNNGRTP